jgi:UDP-N-acetylmuramate: L-alanyl-gamma-D-glutamyl-meso-diaminopimelate ligase
MTSRLPGGVAGEPGEGHRFLADLLPASAKESALVHLTAIGGVGMAAIAGLLHAMGHRVRGSDREIYPPASDELARLGVVVARGYRAENLEPRPDLVVMGNAISADNPEAIAARVLGIPTISLPEALECMCLPGRRSLVVAGTHGKTTSASFLALVLETAGREPGYFIGGAPRDLPHAYALGSGREFVVEGDEYDSAYFDKGPKFLHYVPSAVVLTAIEFDHADIYRDLAHVKSSFARLLAILPSDAPLVVSADFPHAIDVARASGRTFVSFSDSGSSSADWRITRLDDGPTGLDFTVCGPGEEIRLRSPLLGAMNARNLLGIAALCRLLEVAPSDIAAAADVFHGVRRRQEVLLEHPVVLIDDFAHHPTAITATLAAVRSRYPGRRMWALFDPRSNTSRRRVFQDELAGALAAADIAVIGPVFAAEKLAPEERFSPEAAARAIAERGRAAIATFDHDAVVAAVSSQARTGDVVVVLSNGAFGGVVSRLRSALA